MQESRNDHLIWELCQGEQVEDMYIEKGIIYEYKRDFDILAATTHDDLKNNHKIEEKINKE